MHFGHNSNIKIDNYNHNGKPIVNRYHGLPPNHPCLWPLICLKLINEQLQSDDSIAINPVYNE